MTIRTFENLDFSILIEVENKRAYLQQWDDGAWSEPHVFPLPVSVADLQQIPVLSNAVKSFRHDPQTKDLRDTLTHGAWTQAADERAGRLARFWAATQASFRQRARQIG